MNHKEMPSEAVIEQRFNDMLNKLVSFLNALEQMPKTQNKQAAEHLANAAYRLLAKDYNQVRNKTTEEDYVAEARVHIRKASESLGP